MFARLFVLVLTVVVAIPLEAQDSSSPSTRFELSLSNDLLAGDQDDRYTAALAIRVPLAASPWRLDLSERMFTDRDAGQRFDETRLAVVREGLGGGGWSVDLAFGAVRVGHGLLGESAQNAVHGIVGSDDVDLEYLAETKLHLEAGVRVVGPTFAIGPALPNGRRGFVRPELELTLAPSFSNQGSARLLATFPGRLVELRVGVGVHGADSRLRLLDRHLESVAPELSIGITLLERLSLQWTDNHFGTGDGHVHVTWRLGGGQRAGSSAR